MSGGTWDPWTEHHEHLAREFDAYMGVAPSASDAHKLAEDDDGLTDEERDLAPKVATELCDLALRVIVLGSGVC